MEDRTEPDNTTRSSEEAEAARSHEADRAPSNVEKEAAERALEEESPDERKRVAEHYEEMSEIGAKTEGEGRIE